MLLFLLHSFHTDMGSSKYFRSPSVLYSLWQELQMFSQVQLPTSDLGLQVSAFTNTE